MQLMSRLVLGVLLGAFFISSTMAVGVRAETLDEIYEKAKAEQARVFWRA